MACECCLADRECSGHWRYFNEGCVWCGGRILARLGKLKAIPSVILQKRRDMLQAWVKRGHSERELRDLAKAPESLEPIKKEPADGKRKR